MPSRTNSKGYPRSFRDLSEKTSLHRSSVARFKNHHRTRGIAKRFYQSLELSDSQNHWRLSVSFCLHGWLGALIARQDFYPIQYNGKIAGGGGDRAKVPD